MKIDGIEWVLDVEHSSRTALNKYVNRISGTLHIKHTGYGTWQVWKVKK